MNYDNLKQTLTQQKAALANLEAEITALAGSDMAKENAKLKQDLEKLTASYQAAVKTLEELQSLNAGLKTRLYEQMYNEKITLVNNIAHKANIYFNDTNGTEINKLNQFYFWIKTKIDQLNNRLKYNGVAITDEIYAKLQELEKSTAEKIHTVRTENARLHSEMMQESGERLQQLKDEQITDEQIKALAKKNNLEAFIGGNIINKVGIFLIIIGMLLFSRLVYTNITDELKGMMMFGTGGLMLALGEFLNRKKAGVASLGLSAGGIAVLYIAGAVCYFNFEILDMYPAILICVLITAAAFFLSIRYNSQTVTAFALIGGYMPSFALMDGGDEIIYGAMVYFIILNGLALLIAYHKKWTICYFIGFMLNTIGTLFIISLFTFDGWANNDFAHNELLLISYTFFAFLVYTAVPIISTYRTKIAFKIQDIVLLGLNTFISAVIIYVLFYLLKFEDYTGAISVAFTVVYLLLGQFVEKKLVNAKKNAAMLFYLTGLTFVVLFIPFQFEAQWISLGWLVEGTLLAMYGIIKNQKAFTRAGFVINWLCLLAFALYDLIHRLGSSDFFAHKYFALTLASLLLLGAFVYKKRQFDALPTVFRIAALVNLYIYLVYFLFDTLKPWLTGMLAMPVHTANWVSAHVANTLMVMLIFIMAHFMLRSQWVADRWTKVTAFIFYAVGVVMIIMINFNCGVFYHFESDVLVIGIGTALLLLANIIALVGVADLTKVLVSGKRLGIEFYPIIVSSFFVFLLIQNLMIQFELYFSNMIISFLFAITAALWIVYGFVKRFIYIRRSGLALSMFAVAKLILIDLWGQTEGYRIIMFITLGVVLVIISLVYQYFVKRLDLSEVPSLIEKEPEEEEKEESEEMDEPGGEESEEINEPEVEEAAEENDEKEEEVATEEIDEKEEEAATKEIDEPGEEVATEEIDEPGEEASEEKSDEL